MITGTRARQPGLEQIDQLIQDYLSYKGQRRQVEFAFFGGNFFGLPEKRIADLLGAVKPWVDKGAIRSIRCSTRPDTVTPRVLDLVRPFGLDLVELGVQSMDDRVLATAERGHTRQDTLGAIHLLKARGLKVGVQVMVGLPGDTLETALETVRALVAEQPDMARIYPLLVLAGSKLARWYEAGLYRPISLGPAVAQVGQMVALFQAAGIPVIRMGLQAGEMMDDPTQMLAGPWHPAFGHLVHSALMFDRVCERVDGILESGPSPSIVLAVHPRNISRLQGNRKSNLEDLASRYPGITFTVKTDTSLAPDGLVVLPGSCAGENPSG